MLLLCYTTHYVRDNVCFDRPIHRHPKRATEKHEVHGDGIHSFVMRNSMYNKLQENTNVWILFHLDLHRHQLITSPPANMQFKMTSRRAPYPWLHCSSSPVYTFLKGTRCFCIPSSFLYIGRSGMGTYAGAARRRVHLTTVQLRPPSGHRPGRRESRHARIPQIGLHLTQPKSLWTPARHGSAPRISARKNLMCGILRRDSRHMPIEA